MNAAVAQELWKGQTIDGKFPLLEWLGGSTHSAVFRTQLPGPSTQVAAIKLIRADRPDAAQQIARWRALIPLAHPNLLRVFHAGHCQIGGAPWLYVAMEYAEETVDQVLPVRPLSMAEVGELLPPVLNALSFLHAQGLVHSRIKPSNICAVKNQVKLAIDSVHPTNQKVLPYSLTAYDSPESESGNLAVGADMWSLGMTLVAAFDQRPLTWSRSNALDPAVPRSVPAPYAQIARGCLRMIAAERSSLAGIKELMPQAPSLPKPIAPKPTQPKAFIAPLVAVLALALLVIGVKLRHTTPSQPSAVTPAATIEPPSAVQHPTESIGDHKPTAYASKAGAVAKNPAKNTAKAPVQVVNSAPASQGVVNQVLPQVPRSARQTIHGKVKVKVRVVVDPNGNVSAANFVSPGPSRYFARLALEASRQWKFQPTGINGQSAPAQWLLEYRFGRNSTEVTPVASR
jgi:TonB family protein